MRAAAPAYMTRRDGPAYRPIGPRTGLPLPSTQNFQSSGAGGQDGSGRQVFGGTQLRRGGDGQVGGTTNRFNELLHLRIAGASAVPRTRRGMCGLRLGPWSG
jgi:hypothetical protein